MDKRGRGNSNRGNRGRWDRSRRQPKKEEAPLGEVIGNRIQYFRSKNPEFVSPAEDFQDTEDYKIAFETEGIVRIGKRDPEGPLFLCPNRPTKPEETLLAYTIGETGVKIKGKESDYYGNVYYPELRLPEGEPIPEDFNKHFIAGAIVKGKTFHLVTPIDHYANTNIRGTSIELFWLSDNGYTFRPDKDNPFLTIATPSPNQQEKLMVDYFKFRKLDEYQSIFKFQLKGMIKEIVNQVVYLRKATKEDYATHLPLFIPNKSKAQQLAELMEEVTQLKFDITPTVTDNGTFYMFTYRNVSNAKLKNLLINREINKDLLDELDFTHNSFNVSEEEINKLLEELQKLQERNQAPLGPAH